MSDIPLYNSGQFKTAMDATDPEINRILKVRLKEIYPERYRKSEIQSIMEYPMKENLCIVTYNLDLEDSPPIIRAKIVVNKVTEELLQYDPGLL